MDLARGQGIRAVVVGGYALRQYGQARPIKDLDFIASDLIPGMAGRALALGGMRFKTPNAVSVDWFTGKNGLAPLFAGSLDTAVSVWDNLLVVRRDYLIALKVVAGRPKDEHDLEFLLPWAKAHRDQVLSLLGGSAMQSFIDSANAPPRRRKVLAMRGLVRKSLSDLHGSCQDFLEVLTFDYTHSTALGERVRFLYARAMCRFHLGDPKGASDDLSLARVLLFGAAKSSSVASLRSSRGLGEAKDLIISMQDGTGSSPG